MNPIQKAIDALGSQAQMAMALGVRQPTISEWVRGSRPIPVERCVQIEQATAGLVRRWDLRPDDWHRIWPELVGVKGAPKPAPAQQHGSPPRLAQAALLGALKGESDQARN